MDHVTITYVEVNIHVILHDDNVRVSTSMPLSVVAVPIIGRRILLDRHEDIFEVPVSGIKVLVDSIRPKNRMI